MKGNVMTRLQLVRSGYRGLSCFSLKLPQQIASTAGLRCHSPSNFCHALLALSHPVSILAMLILLLNDHWWRQVAPSWFTGKIGDVAWLIFAPFLLATLLAWLLSHRAEWIGPGSIIFTGLVFALVKSVPAVHAGFVDLFRGLLGWAPATRLDSTDLLALPALLIAWCIWECSSTPITYHRRRGWLLMMIGAVLTMANVGASPNVGVRCVTNEGSRLLAIAWVDEKSSARFVSDDGGLTWQEETPGYTDCPNQIFISAREPLLVKDPVNPMILYRINVGRSIERSEDGGQAWQQDFNLGGEEARIRAWDILFDWPLGPFDAVVQSSTGHLIAAMGREGVLVRTPAGAWQWVNVGPYAVTELNRVDRVTVLLSEEVGMALVFGLLTLATLLRAVRKVKWSGPLLFIAWLVGVLICFQFKPNALNERYILEGAIKPASYAVAIVALLLLVPPAISAWRERRRALGMAFVIAFAAPLVFITPYVLWTQGIIPFYGTAAGLAFLTLAVIVSTGFFYMRRLNNALGSEGRPHQTISDASGGAA